MHQYPFKFREEVKGGAEETEPHRKRGDGFTHPEQPQDKMPCQEAN